MNLLRELKRCSFSKAPRIVALGVLLCSCKGIHFSEPTGYGLKLVSLNITAEEYGLLNGQLLSKRPAALEIDLKDEFKVNCSASYAGRSSIDSYRKSYDLNFCDEKYNKRTHYRLSAQAIDKTMVRSLIGYEIFKALGLETVKAELASAYINQKFIGLYILMETVDKEFFKARKIEIEEIYKARYGNAGFREDFASKVQEAFSYDGKGEDDYTFILEIYKSLWLDTDDAAFASKVDRVLDIDGFLAYAAGAVFIDHWDGLDNNYFLAFDKGKNKLVTVPWDLDRTWEKIEDFTPEALTQKNALLTRLLKLPIYRKAFRAKITQLQKDYPADKLIKMSRKYEDKGREAYGNDPILARYQSTCFVDLEVNFKAWSAHIDEYLVRNPE